MLMLENFAVATGSRSIRIELRSKNKSSKTCSSQSELQADKGSEHGVSVSLCAQSFDFRSYVVFEDQRWRSLCRHPSIIERVFSRRMHPVGALQVAVCIDDFRSDFSSIGEDVISASGHKSDCRIMLACPTYWLR